MNEIWMKLGYIWPVKSQNQAIWGLFKGFDLADHHLWRGFFDPILTCEKPKSGHLGVVQGGSRVAWNHEIHRPSLWRGFFKAKFSEIMMIFDHLDEYQNIDPILDEIRLEFILVWRGFFKAKFSVKNGVLHQKGVLQSQNSFSGGSSKPK